MRQVSWCWVAVALVACGGGELDGASVPSAPSAQAGSAGAASAGKAGAPSAAGAGAGGQLADAPRILSANFTPYQQVPLGGTLDVVTDRPTRLTVEIGDGGTHALTVTDAALTAQHSVPVLQLRAGTKYAMLVKAEDDSGAASEPEIVKRETPPLPADFPPLAAKAKDATRDGLTLFGVARWGAMGPQQDWGYLVAVDGAAEVVWYLPLATSVNHVARSPAGNVRVGVGDGSFADVSPGGTPLRGWVATARLPAGTTLPAGVTGVDVDTLHHDAVELPNGNFLALSTELRTVTKAMCPATYDQDWDVVGDVVVEIEPATGKVLRRVSMFDLIDPCRRQDHAFKTDFWSAVYGTQTADWTHANAVFFDQKRNAVLVSLRHQDWVVAYRYAADADGPAGSLLFRLGPEGDFQLAGDGAAWNYQQHAARVLSNGNIMMYDNGSSRPGTSPVSVSKYPWSRSLELALDTSGPKGTWTATQVWDYGTNDVRLTDTSTGAPVELRWYSQIIGIADVTPANTVLAVHGAATDPPTGLVAAVAVKKLARIFEVTREPTPKVVLDVRVHDEVGVGSYSVYRAVRVPTMYPTGAVTATVTKR